MKTPKINKNQFLVHIKCIKEWCLYFHTFTTTAKQRGKAFDVQIDLLLLLFGLFRTALLKGK